MTVKRFVGLTLFAAAACALGILSPASGAQKSDKPPDKKAQSAWLAKCKTWLGTTMSVETANVTAEYPDFADPGEANRHAEFLQKVFDQYVELFAMKGGDPFGGQKIRFRLMPAWSVAETVADTSIKLGIGTMAGGIAYPPDRVYFHEMAHAFQMAQMKMHRDYIYHCIGGMNEALAMLFECDIATSLSSVAASPTLGRVCGDWLAGRMDTLVKSKDETLSYFESHKPDPYALDWGRHPRRIKGEPFRSGEWYFLQMLYRVTDRYGWDIWPRFFAQTAKSGGSPAAKAMCENQKHTRPDDPVFVKAVAEFVDDLGRAAGDDLRPMFRRWGFRL